MNDDHDDESSPPELTDDERALLSEMPELTDVGPTRRAFVQQTITTSLGLFALDLLALEKAFGALPRSPEAISAATSGLDNLVSIILKVNGASHPLEIDSRTVLLDVLRERLALTGSKKGCD